MKPTVEAPRHFASSAAWERWLELHHAKVRALTVGLFRRSATPRGPTYAEILDGALAFGWIDGVRRRIDDERWSIRFSPRKPCSYWSAVNLSHYARLAREGRIRPAGRRAYGSRVRTPPGRYSYENRPRTLPRSYREFLREQSSAWAYFSAQPPWYRRSAAFWVLNAKREETRMRRLAWLRVACGAGRRLPSLDLIVRRAGERHIGGAVK